MNWPNSPEGWLGLISPFAIMIFGIWKAWERNEEKINGLGTRVDAVVVQANTNKTSIDLIKEQISEERTAFMTQMFNNEQAAAERHRVLSVQLARVEERLDIKTIVSDTIREFRREP